MLKNPDPSYLDLPDMYVFFFCLLVAFCWWISEQILHTKGRSRYYVEHFRVGGDCEGFLARNLFWLGAFLWRSITWQFCPKRWPFWGPVTPPWLVSSPWPELKDQVWTWIESPGTHMFRVHVKGVSCKGFGFWELPQKKNVEKSVGWLFKKYAKRNPASHVFREGSSM